MSWQRTLASQVEQEEQKGCAVQGVCCAGDVLCRAHANQSNKLPGLSDLLVSQKNNQLIN